MNIKCIETGYLNENCYIVEDENDCLIIDPGDDYDLIKSNIDKNVLAVLITHRHFDHIGALSNLINDYNCQIFDKNTCNEETYKLNNFSFNVIFTPGHSMDSITFYFYRDKIMFVGDFVFKGSIGRCDLDGGNMSMMKDSINKLKKFDSSVVLYPGHGELTSIKDEINDNIYFIN